MLEKLEIKSKSLRRHFAKPTSFWFLVLNFYFLYIDIVNIDFNFEESFNKLCVYVWVLKKYVYTSTSFTDYCGGQGLHTKH